MTPCKRCGEPTEAEKAAAERKAAAEEEERIMTVVDAGVWEKK